MANILIACEFSGIVREAFRKQGHKAFSCDLLPSDDNSPYHCQGDIKEFFKLFPDWDLIIAHPPCTRLANSGVRWLQERNLWNEMREGAEFFKFFLTLSEKNCPRIAVENPIPHKYAVEIIGRKYDQIIQPWQYGEPYSKATCLWLRNLPKLQPTKIIPVEEREQKCHLLPPSKDRWKLRSVTYQGIADAMASQWGKVL